MAEEAVETRGTERTVVDEGKNMQERKISWAKLRRVDSLNLEAGRVSTLQTHAFKVHIDPSIDLSLINAISIITIYPFHLYLYMVTLN